MHPVIEKLTCVIVGPHDVFLEEAQKLAEIKAFERINEGQMALMAGSGEKWGILALSGTGSDVFAPQPDYLGFIGGWGTILGDEGSGYDLGMWTLRAAIWAYDGRGPETMILPMLMEAWQLKEPWDMVEKVYGAKDNRGLVASAAKIASKAAHAGDAVALKLYEDAAHQLALLVNTLMKKHPEGIVGPVVASGGTWKGHPVMFESFCREVLEQNPRLNILWPEFEPIIGCLVSQALERGTPKEEFWPVLEENFAEFRYR